MHSCFSGQCLECWSGTSYYYCCGCCTRCCCGRGLLVQAESTPISSCLVDNRRGMKRAMLEVIAAGAVASPNDVERYLKCR